MIIGILFILFANVGFVFKRDNEGQKLAKIHCSSCHQYPEPSLLTKKGWQKVLPAMGAFMGMQRYDSIKKQILGHGFNKKVLLENKIFASTPLVSEKDWDRLVEFYIKTSPESFDSQPKVDMRLQHFSIQNPPFKIDIPATTYIGEYKNDLLVGDYHSHRLIRLSKSQNVKEALVLGPGPVSAIENEKGLFVATIGDFSPSEVPQGRVSFIPHDHWDQETSISPKLQRPVDLQFIDVDKNGLDDIVVAEYGKYTGKLSLLKQESNGDYHYEVIADRSGALCSQVLDIDGDGDQDIIVLFGQGREELALFRNNNGKFSYKSIHSFPPSYGSVKFYFKNVDEDSANELIYINGDNADFFGVNKNYHGIRVFDFNKDESLTEKMFFRVDGAYDAVFEDFDLDGDMDIAAVSFFPDFSSEFAGFTYFQNNSGHYIRKSTPTKGLGRWIKMISIDIDNDSDNDIILSALTFEAPGYEKLQDSWLKTGYPYIILENKIK